VACPCEHEGLDIRQPLEQQLLTLVKARIAVFTENGENGLLNPSGLGGPKRPLTQRRQLVREERVRIRESL
jgi:hypothetical protein